MNHDDRERISTVINYFWGEDTAAPHAVTRNVAKVAFEALQEAQSCTAAMDMVPRPGATKAGPRYAAKQLAKIGKRIASGDTSQYETCRSQVAVAYKSRINMALMGL
ncbi:hypothetical protein [Thioalkalivibrio sp. ALR17-21]|uniref:hypothetical protein n=1 Tax=Thioalkalivibrio sp. ALR17-21 TaxID=1269813 RepID=UPI00046270E2|nr:hypothetical protein [Thioalkalivibrio sp. ALR17-21]